MSKTVVVSIETNGVTINFEKDHKTVNMNFDTWNSSILENTTIQLPLGFGPHYKIIYNGISIYQDRIIFTKAISGGIIKNFTWITY